jgi:GNAT superfamily N-acetyltransferase
MFGRARAPISRCDSHDEHGEHWVALDTEGLPIAAARLCVHESAIDIPNAFLRYELGPSPYGSLNRLVVHPDFRGKGIAQEFDRARLKRAGELSAKTLLACALEDRAHRLVKNGWTLLGGARNEFDPSPLAALGTWMVLTKPT